MRGGRPSSRSLKSIPLRAGDAPASPLPVPSPGATARCRFAGFIAIGEHDHVRTVSGRSSVRSPDVGSAPMPVVRPPAWRRGRSRFLRRPSADRRVRRGAPRRRDKARASSSRDRPAPCAVAGKEGPVDRYRCAVNTERHERHHRGPDAARWMLRLFGDYALDKYNRRLFLPSYAALIISILLLRSLGVQGVR